MKWYIAKLSFRIHVGGATVDQFEEQLRVISARNENEAFLKARMLGAREEDVFLNDSLNAVRWVFLDVTNLKSIDALEDGLELDSVILERDDAASYIRFVQERSVSIEQRTLSHAVSTE